MNREIMSSLQQLIDSGTVDKVTSSQGLPKYRSTLLLLVHRASKQYAISKTYNAPTYLAVHRGRCKATPSTKDSPIFSQFTLSTEPSDWEIYAAVAAYDMKVFDSAISKDLDGFRKLKILSGSSKTESNTQVEVDVNVYRVVAKGSSIVRWTVSAVSLTADEAIKRVNAALSKVNIVNGKFSKGYPKAQDFKEERGKFLRSSQYWVSHIKNPPVVSSLKGSYAQLTTRLNDGSIIIPETESIK